MKAPILEDKYPGRPSVFQPHALLREARRQKAMPEANVPHVCFLDPDGDLVRTLVRSGRANLFPGWPCYHTDLYMFDIAGRTFGIIGRVVGASFAVLVAEELFANGCKLLISLTSAGQIVPAGDPPYFVIIDRALRDEGTSYHYAAPAEYAEGNPYLVAAADAAAKAAGLSVVVGASWTTDAPFRETEEAIRVALGRGILAVEMEAAALHSFAQYANVNVLCLAHVTNTMGLAEQDFEKGEGDGSADALRLLGAVAIALSANLSL